MLKRSWLLFRLILVLALLTACGSGRSAGDKYGVRRGPYLQSVTPDSVWVVWETVKPVVGRVEWGATAELGQVVQEEQAALQHEVQLTGLQPYSTYYYRVGEGEVASFRSAAAADQTAFRFAVIGDTQTNHKPHRAVIDRVVEAAPDFVIHTGDQIEHGESLGQRDDFFAIEAALLRTAPIWPTKGNHERDNASYFDAFRLPGNERWYAFDYGNARFICLEADNYPDNDRFPNAEQLAWLEQELANNTQPWLFVFLHVAVYTSTGEEDAETGTRSRLVPLFERYGVDVVLMGHEHLYERVVQNGITYITSGGAGGSLSRVTKPERGSVKLARAHHFVLMEMDGDHLTGTAIDVDGNVLDKFELVSGK